MFNIIINKLPSNYKRKMRKNFSCDNCKSKENNKKIIFKIRDRLFSPRSLSLLSRNKYKFDKNYLKNPTPNSLDEFLNKNFRYKSFDNQAFLSYIPEKKHMIKKNETIEEFDYLKYSRKQGPSVLFLRDIKLDDIPTTPKTLDIDKKRILLINQIIKFNLSKKKEENKRNILPMQFGKDYND